MQRGRYAVVKLPGGEPFHQRLRLSEKLLVRGRILAALFDQVVQQLRHLLVEPGIGELVADNGLADVVDDPFRNRIPGQLALFVKLASDGVVDAGFDDRLRQRHLAQLTEIRCRVGLDVRVEQMAHVRLVRPDVQFLARVLLDGRTDLAVELDFFLDGGCLGVRVPGLRQVLRHSREGSYVDSDGLVKRDPQGLGLIQRIRVNGVAAEVVQVLLHFARQLDRFAQVAQRLAGLIQPLPALAQPVLEVNVVVATTT